MNLGNYQKTPIGESLARIPQAVVLTEMQKQGKAFPCTVVAVSGQIVTVKFEVVSSNTLPQISIPIATSRYDWLPVQVGDQGITVPADVYLGGISGLGGGTADMAPRANLAALLFLPCANKAWTTTNASMRVVQGPDGVLIQDMNGDAKVTVTPTIITLSCGGHSLTISSAGVETDGNIYESHYHVAPSGGGNTGPPIS